MSRVSKNREILFNLIKDTYEKDILTYDMSLDSLPKYLESHKKIFYLLEGINVTRFVVERRLGKEFGKWFFETHDNIIEGFFGGKL